MGLAGKSPSGLEMVLSPTPAIAKAVEGLQAPSTSQTKKPMASSAQPVPTVRAVIPSAVSETMSLAQSKSGTGSAGVMRSL